MTTIYMIVGATLLLPLLFAGNTTGTALPIKNEVKPNCVRNPSEDAEF